MILNVFKKFCRFSSGQNLKIRSSISPRQGGLSSIPISSIVDYQLGLQQDLNLEFKQSVRDFKRLIKQNHLIKMDFNDQVLKSLPIRQNGRLLGDNVQQAMKLLNTAITTPPKFEQKDLIGIPIFTLFFDYLQSKNGQKFFAKTQVNSLLKNIFHDYAQLLDSPQSLKNIQGWISGQALKYWNPCQYKVDQNAPNFGFKNWHEFFLRDFKQEFRPIAQGKDVIASVCQSYPLTIPAMPVENVALTDNFWLKDNKYSIRDMVGAKQSQNLDQFQGGTVYQAFLNPWTYHKWHAPVDGYMVDVCNIPGAYYLQNPGIQDNYNPIFNKNGNYINSQPFLTCTSTRQVFKIKADNQKIGNMYIIMVGMGEVSSCVAKVAKGDKFKKGDCLGEFRLGGSSHCVIFNRNCTLDFSKSMKDAYFFDPRTGGLNSRRINVRSHLAQLVY